nr:MULTISPECIES: YhcU family protein [Cytobacillus]
MYILRTDYKDYKGGLSVKVVFASTPDQEQKIQELIRKFYSNVFPLYFTDDDIREFEQQKILHTSTRHFEYFGTLKEAYQVIAGLQTLMAILESRQMNDKYEMIFAKNVQILQEFGLSFPFAYSHFCGERMPRNNLFSVYAKAANEMLV